MDSRIGILMRNGKKVCYAFFDGKYYERSNACAMHNWLMKLEERKAKKQAA